MSTALDADGPWPTRADVAAGLSSFEARRRLERDGPNRLPTPRRPHPLAQLLHQMVNLFALMLWGASVLAALAGMPQLTVAIIVVVVINGVFAFAQEYRADKAAERLHQLVPARARVRRDGEPLTVPVDDVVEGDLLLLQAGERVAADTRLSPGSRWPLTSPC